MERFVRRRRCVERMRCEGMRRRNTDSFENKDSRNERTDSVSVASADLEEGCRVAGEDVPERSPEMRAAGLSSKWMRLLPMAAARVADVRSCRWVRFTVPDWLEALEVAYDGRARSGVSSAD